MQRTQCSERYKKRKKLHGLEPIEEKDFETIFDGKGTKNKLRNAGAL